jgi:hypothetical protein
MYADELGPILGPQLIQAFNLVLGYCYRIIIYFKIDLRVGIQSGWFIKKFPKQPPLYNSNVDTTSSSRAISA